MVINNSPYDSWEVEELVKSCIELFEENSDELTSWEYEFIEDVIVSPLESPEIEPEDIDLTEKQREIVIKILKERY